MRQPIYADYTTAENGWTVTVTCDGQQAGDRVEGGLVAARDRADTLVATVAATAGHRPVVHLLDGDALVFTTAYLSERLGIPADAHTGSAVAPVVAAESAPGAVEPDPATAEQAPAPPTEDAGEPTG
ncbi:hypothetical protein [Actinokineospora spheciospongiae]|uniref:hypothetical protein n=1 Tax=Actinokineospora spheciospongiae TaxID=909613 RepID=UPI000D718A86|nr:hypothetical protein [Actinokineospora spheciospongiae]PWW60276.1 hypothetical protein DFQ13_10772 [Actinokineospora spheciospongiae]